MRFTSNRAAPTGRASASSLKGNRHQSGFLGLSSEIAASCSPFLYSALHWTGTSSQLVGALFVYPGGIIAENPWMVKHAAIETVRSTAYGCCKAGTHHSAPAVQQSGGGRKLARTGRMVAFSPAVVVPSTLGRDPRQVRCASLPLLGCQKIVQLP